MDFHSWGLGKKLSAIVFMLVSILLVSLMVGISVTSFKELKKRSIEDISLLVGSVRNMLDVYENTVRQDAIRANNLLDLNFPSAFEIDTSNRVTIDGNQLDTMKNGDIIINLDSKIVDRFSEKSNALATVFLKQGDDFIRISTSVKKENGERAVGTPLDRSSGAYTRLINGQAYTGLSRLFGKNYMTMYKPIRDKEGMLIGATFTGINIEDSLAELKDKIKSIKIAESGILFALNLKQGKDLGVLTIHPTLENSNVASVIDVEGRAFVKEIIERKNGVTEYSLLDLGVGRKTPRDTIAIYSYSKSFDWVIVGNVPADELNKSTVTMLGIFSGLSFILLLVFAYVVSIAIRRNVTIPLLTVVSVAQEMARGKLISELDTDRGDELGKLNAAMNGIALGLSRAVNDVKTGSQVILTAAKEVANGNAELSRRTEDQSNSLEQTASSMEEITTSVQKNAESVHHVKKMVEASCEVALRGGEIVRQVVMTMTEIKQSSTQIGAIVEVIEGITFQTNILALNASVEAARAGEHGSGFAVVASEVRDLAKRSANAAKEIKKLIDSSVVKVENGNNLVVGAGDAMKKIVESIELVTLKINEINLTSQEQGMGISEVNAGIMELELITQQNAALAEEVFAATEDMRQRSDQLLKTVGKFEIMN